MELKYLLLFGIVNVVSAIPHGYEVKSGAIAKAGAISGAFPSLPGLSNAAGATALGSANSFSLGGSPNAAGIGVLGGSFSSSGSFSKSSASSFASSSAGSYSFSGSGGPGNLIGNNQAAFPGHANQESANAPGTYTAPSTSISSNNAAAAAGSQSFAGAGLSDSANNNNGPDSIKCTPGTSGCENTKKYPEYSNDGVKITTNLNTAQAAATNLNTAQAAATSLGSSSLNNFGLGSNCGGGACDTTFTENKCVTGNCRQNIPSQNDKAISTQYSGTKTSYDADAQSPYYNVKSPINSCNGNNCDVPHSGTIINNDSNSGTQNIFPPKELDKCSGPNCKNFNFNASPSSQTYQPSSVLTTPKETGIKTEPCTSGNCNGDKFSLYPGFIAQTSKVPCTSSTCGTNEVSGVISNSNTDVNNAGVSHTSNAILKPQGTKCTSPNCEHNSPYTPNYSNIPIYESSKLPSSGISNCGSPYCGNTAGAQANFGAAISTGGYDNSRPNYYTQNSPNNQPIYSGGFGAPSGVLNPNDYAKPHFNHQQKPSSSANYPTTGVLILAQKPSQPIYSGGFGGPSGILKPNDYSIPTNIGINNSPKPIENTKISTPTQNVQSSAVNDDSELNFVPLKPNKEVSNGNNYAHNQINSFANAAAGASAAVYTGGFGGPPGYLKPYDNADKSSFNPKFSKYGSGSSSNGINNKDSSYSGNNYNIEGAGSSSGAGVSSSLGAGAGSSLNAGVGSNGGTGAASNLGAGSGSSLGSAAGSSSGAFASAGALAGAGSFGNGGYYDKQSGLHNGANAGDCGGGCSGNINGGHGGNTGFSLGGSFGLSKTGLFDGLAGGLNAAGAAAKSIAGAVSSAGAGLGSIGLSGGFAGSSASAHASSGAVAKGGYVRR